LGIELTGAWASILQDLLQWQPMTPTTGAQNSQRALIDKSPRKYCNEIFDSGFFQWDFKGWS
jgi:hypothetical protein